MEIEGYHPKKLPTGTHVQVTEYGSDQLAAIESSLSLIPQPPPSPAELHDGDLVIAVRATAIEWTDTIMITGQYVSSLILQDLSQTLSFD